MVEGLGLAVLLLPLGVALGWYLRTQRSTPENEPGSLSSDYLAGLSFLANDDPDQAIAALMRAVEVDDQTVELHLTLGNLFRRRGEVDRALRLHQNILARPSLDPRYVNAARFELAQDYHKAGLLDRAEALFGELAAEGMFLDPALAALLSIHEQTHDWDKAVDEARRLEAVRGQTLRPLIAHYRCERAGQHKADGDLAAAEKLAEKALSEYPGSVRASFALGEIREARKDYKGAVRAYERVPEQDLRFYGEVLPKMERAYTAARDLAGYWKYLEEAEGHYASVQPVLARAKLMQSEGVDASAFLVEHMRDRPTWQGLYALLQSIDDQAAPDSLPVLRRALKQSIESAPRYRCEHCGLTPKLLFWQCPSCKQWGSVVPAGDDIRLAS